MKKQILKKYFAQIIAAVVLIGGIAVPVAAAASEQPAEVERDSSPYITYSQLKLYSGVIAYTSSGASTSQTAAVKMTNVVYNGASSDISIQVGTFATSGETQIGDYKSITRGGTVEFPKGASYPGQSIKAGFYKENINGVYYLTGRYYYNGL